MLMKLLTWIGLGFTALCVLSVIAFVLFVFYVSNPRSYGAGAVNKELSNQYHRKDGEIVYVSGGNFFSLGETAMPGVDAASFEVIDYSYAKDRNHVYVNGERLAGADPNSVTPVPIGASLKGGNKRRSSDFLISADKVFFYRNVIDEAEPESFVHVLGAYGMDNHFVYFANEIRIPRTATPSLIPNADESYLRMGALVLYLGKVISEEAGRFKIINDKYSKDSKHVFDQGEIVEAMDAFSFQVISPYFNKDKNQAYYFNYPIIGSDPNSFQVFNDDISKDKNNVYFNDHLIANRESSEVTRSVADKLAKIWLWRPLHLNKSEVIMVPADDVEDITNQYLGYQNEVYSRDEKLVGVTREDIVILDDEKNFCRIGSEIYTYGMLIPGADTETFEVLSETFSKDQKHVYYYQDRVSGVDPQSFVYEEGLYAEENEAGEYVLVRHELSL